ncbi:MAG: PCRF domain-containing protein [Candidatus Vogelbacteria bacterium]
MIETEKQITELERQMSLPNFWTDKVKAQTVIEEHKRLKLEMENGDAGGQYDQGDAIITIFSGAGGDDAEDFSRMLFEMYTKYATRRGYELFLIHENQNDHGGYRNLTFEVRGKSAYGTLKAESGVHRLVRVSPFSAKKLRHTSFSLVEVIPRFSAKGGLASGEEIPEKDLKIEFSRSSGPGGQNVNKRETAVRIVHLPTGLAAHSDSERLQERNKEKALDILKAKLYKRQEEERHKKEAGMYISKTMEIEWGSQIRSYVLHPYKMVKDHRTGTETTQVDAVLNGELDEFIEAELKLD